MSNSLTASAKRLSWLRLAVIVLSVSASVVFWVAFHRYKQATRLYDSAATEIQRPYVLNGLMIRLDRAAPLRWFPEDPIAKRIKPGLRTNETETPWREIVAVAGDVRERRLREEAQPTYYIPYAQGLITALHLVVRTVASPSAVVSSIRKTIAERDPELAISDERTMDEYLDRSVAGARFDTLLLASFAVLGLVLTVVGLYGVTANGVAERTHEFGVRMALGASAGVVVAGVLRRGVLLTGTGLASGLLAAAFASRLLAAGLYEVRPLDPLTFVAVGAALLGVGLLACWIPARRATAVDPIRALRCE